jgi:hypothetical protein
MQTFRQYIENLWGNIPCSGRKPSDGQGGQSTNPSRPEKSGGGAMSGMPTAPLGMMKKHMKKMRKS